MIRTFHPLVLAFIAPSIVCHAEDFLASIPAVKYEQVPQFDSQLCWAAATEIVINSFYPSAQSVSQFQLAEDARKHDRDESCGSCSLSGWTKCCDRPGFPDFEKYGFDVDLSRDAKALKWQDLQRELADRDRPFIFGWKYDDDDDDDDDALHFMVVVRYWTSVSGKHWVDIWDPLPKGEGNAYSLTYDNYAVKTATELNNDMGEPVKYWAHYTNVRAKSSPIARLQVPGSQFGGNLSSLLVSTKFSGAARVVPVSQSVGASLPVTTATPPGVSSTAAARESASSTRLRAAMPGVPVTQAILESRQLAGQALEDADLPNLAGANGSVKGKPGFPFPVVALSLSELRKADRSTVGRLLQKQINVVLYPVEFPGKVADNFLMIRSGRTWQQGGYANLTVTRSLVELREKARPRNDDERSRFYLLSVPALGGFFLGHGTGTDARLMSTTSVNSDIRGGVWYPADKVLQVVMDRAKGYVLPEDPRGRPTQPAVPSSLPTQPVVPGRPPVG